MPSPTDPSSDQAPADSRKFVHGAGYFGSVALGVVLVAAVLWRGATPTAPAEPSHADAAVGVGDGVSLANPATGIAAPGWVTSTGR